MEQNNQLERVVKGGVLGLVSLFLIMGLFFMAKNVDSLSSPVGYKNKLVGHLVPQIDAVGFASLSGRALLRSITNLKSVKGSRLFVGDMRVIAIGSAFPIPYGAELCPFSGMPQPSIDQLDWDGDGMLDQWEIVNGLDRYSKVDACKDFDQDGFSNKEEFDAQTDPLDPTIHPSYILKMRLAKEMKVSFPFTFQGVSELPDGRTIFQLNRVDNSRSYFLEIGDILEGICVAKRSVSSCGLASCVVYRQGGAEIELPLGKVVADTRSKGELINILDRSSEIVTMGTLFSLCNNKFLVLAVSAEKVSVQSVETQEKFEVVGFANGEREALFEGLEE